MSKKDLEQFLKKILNSKDLQSRISDGIDSDEALIALASEQGFEFTAEDLQEAEELSDKELDAVSGGGLKAAISGWRQRRLAKLATKMGIADEDGSVNYFIGKSDKPSGGTEYWDDGTGDPTKVN